MEYSTYGRHVALDAWGIEFDRLNEVNELTRRMVQAAEGSGATILSVQGKQFEPQGVTVLVLLSESHLSIHTYPEKGFAALDCYTCGETVDPRQALEAMLAYLQPEAVHHAQLIRGMGALQVAAGTEEPGLWREAGLRREA
ncbi:adenosylmethionine decarboxylase [Paenibacillus athensensis]|uniref:S-adenosylmethionine decarboxylase proenzyme n=1 Tax=Paenibacillus athensensis TaxID=1967502 RepID=A0A4Y8Q968_9BACL|nr:adenosylmethionine decarboxylase [Paenibacillus athensensis]MCD1260138.1 adenosylmethionine decarboxylase [Paenibacillus athensensis]